MEIIHHHNFKGGFCSKNGNKYSAVFTGLKVSVMYIITSFNNPRNFIYTKTSHVYWSCLSSAENLFFYCFFFSLTFSDCVMVVIYLRIWFANVFQSWYLTINRQINILIGKSIHFFRGIGELQYSLWPFSYV